MQTLLYKIKDGERSEPEKMCFSSETSDSVKYFVGQYLNILLIVTFITANYWTYQVFFANNVIFFHVTWKCLGDDNPGHPGPMHLKFWGTYPPPPIPLEIDTNAIGGRGDFLKKKGILSVLRCDSWHLKIGGGRTAIASLYYSGFFFYSVNF